jgi:triosephosphate isomerase
MGAQDVCVLAEQGAFTSAVSLPMLASASTAYVLAGHSERRSVFGETNEEIAQKLRATLNAGAQAEGQTAALLPQRARRPR